MSNFDASMRAQLSDATAREITPGEYAAMLRQGASLKAGEYRWVKVAEAEAARRLADAVEAVVGSTVNLGNDLTWENLRAALAAYRETTKSPGEDRGQS